MSWTAPYRYFDEVGMGKFLLEGDIWKKCGLWGMLWDAGIYEIRILVASNARVHDGAEMSGSFKGERYAPKAR